jgi:hypothetical protein
MRPRMPAVHVSVSMITADAVVESETVSQMHTPQTDCLSLAHFLTVLLVHRKPLPPVPALSDATAAATTNPGVSSVAVIAAANIAAATATTEEVEEEVGNLVDLDFAKANISGTRSNGGRAAGGAADYGGGAGVEGSSSSSSSACTQITTLQVARRLVKLGLDISDLLASGAGTGTRTGAGAGASAAGGVESEALTEHVLVTPPSESEAEAEAELESAGEAAVVVSAENIAAESNNSVGYVML